MLDVDGRLLANHKIFTRTQLVAELAPHLYGRDPSELDRVLEHVVTSRAVVPLIGVAGAREQAYTTVEVLTAEATIAQVVETLATRAGPTVDPDQIAAAIAEREQNLGRRLTDGQRRVVQEVCGSGTAVRVVIGVAGSGKTTALDTVTALLERSGCRVLGTSTSGQAARTLGREAHLDATTSRRCCGDSTTASSPSTRTRWWLSMRPAWLTMPTSPALRSPSNTAHASLVLIGDHHQLAAVGPGGALAALIDRHPELTVTLDHNVRQHDPGERHAVAELRDGSVATAIDWYATTGRIDTRADRVQTLAAMTEAWAHDLTNGHDSALFAWRRADVNDVNRLARHHWDRHGHLHSDDIEITPGRWYAVGDQLVALAPNPTAGIVTSERLTITAIDDRSLDACTSDGRTVRITGDGLDAEHLDYGYTCTVHRAQGATVDRAHVLAAGGGRELAYVALSRARHRTRIYATADNLAQAVDDLYADWNQTHHQRWITDTPAQPGHRPEPPQRRTTVVSTDEPLLQERRALAQVHLAMLQDDHRDLRAATGRWADTPQGHATRALTEAKQQLQHAHHVALDPAFRRRERRAAARAIPELERTVTRAQAEYDQVCAPALTQLHANIRTARTEIEHLDAQAIVQRVERLRQRLPRPPVEPDLGISL